MSAGPEDLMSGSAVTYEVAAGVAHIQLNRPDAANALDMALALELRAAAERARWPPQVTLPYARSRRSPSRSSPLSREQWPAQGWGSCSRPT